MKVVKTKTPTEDVTFENVFGERYTPTDEEEFKIILEWCPVEEVEDLKEDILWLAEDVLEHEDVLHMLGEKIQSVEDNQLQDIENLSETVKILECMQKANRMMLDVIMDQDRWIRKLDKLSAIWAVVVFVWLAVLTVLFWIYVL